MLDNCNFFYFVKHAKEINEIVCMTKRDVDLRNFETNVLVKISFDLFHQQIDHKLRLSIWTYWGGRNETEKPTLTHIFVWIDLPKLHNVIH